MSSKQPPVEWHFHGIQCYPGRLKFSRQYHQSHVDDETAGDDGAWDARDA
eukprot:CAMPEP_0196233904 /NCGR_PEP_ID=MMETSP0913-20130531/4159_1 /TAXON_ID=49265 /ORGANISM="Thalassiosira rotula, Strain GSO102" /LENGTH=49 /DNA_ID= /DNA_START= /DNA_END= /DNA_ORIENTATION=